MSIGELIASFFTAPGPGGVVVIVVIGVSAVIYTRLTRWILRGSSEDDETRRSR
jgi:hypothetical protein